MNPVRLVTQSLRSLARHRVRTGFMMLGSLVGVAALTVAVSLGQGIQAKVVRTVRQTMGDAAVIVMGGGSRMMGSPRAGAARLTIDDISAVADEVPAIQDWDPQAELSGVAVRRGGATATARVLGQSERWSRVWGRGVSRGESFDAAAVAGAARVALIGETAARTLFQEEDPLDGEILIGGVSFRVIGVLEPFGIDMHGMDRDNEILVPVSTLMRRVTNTDVIATAKLLVDDPEHSEAIARDVTAILRRRHGLDRDRPDDFKLLTAIQAREMVGLVRRVLVLYVPLVAAVILAVGGIVAAALMLGAVNERVSEIGLRRAVGARTEDILRQFVLETAVTLTVGGVGGVVLGWLTVQAIEAHLHFNVATSWSAVAIGLAASAVTGVLAGLVPARRAARLAPAESLR